MACLATLKRGHELDNYGQPFEGLSPKRRRCSTNRSAFAPSNSSKSAAAQERKLDVQSLSDGLSEPISQFPRLPSMETSEILNSVTANYRQLKRRRLLPPKSPKQSSAPGGSTPPRSDPRSSPPSSSSDSDEFGNPTTQKIKKISESLQERNCHSPEAKKSQPMPDQIIRLTFRNVATICEALLKQRENSIREEYDKVLQQKLAEQYEVFCRYSQDQLRQHKPSSSSSYIS